MQITVNSVIKLTSESASKKMQNNAKAFFGTKGVSIVSKLEEYKKEKAINTADLDLFLQWLSKADEDVAGAMPKTAAGKKMQAAFRAVATAKTFPAIMKALKAAKVNAAIKKAVAGGPTGGPTGNPRTSGSQVASIPRHINVESLFRSANKNANLAKFGWGDTEAKEEIYNLFSKHYSPKNLARFESSVLNSDFDFFDAKSPQEERKRKSALTLAHNALIKAARVCAEAGLSKKQVLSDVLKFK